MGMSKQRKSKSSIATKVAQEPPPRRAFVDENETGEQLDVAVQTLRNWRVRGLGPPFFRFGRLVRYSPQQNQAWAEAQRTNSTSARKTA